MGSSAPHMTTAVFMMVALLALVTPAAGVAAPAMPGLGQRGGAVLIIVVNREQALEYRVTAESMKPQLLARSSCTARTSDQLAETIRNLKDAREQRRRAAKEVTGARLNSARWATPSPDGVYALIGFEDPAVQATRAALLVRSSDGVVLAEVRPRGSIRDVRWLPGTDTVITLEATERWKKSLSGLLRILLGHPVPMNSFYLRALDAATAREHVFDVVADVENAEGCLCAPAE